MRTTTEDRRLITAAEKIAEALNEAEREGFHITLDEGGDRSVTIWSEDRENWSEAAPSAAGWVVHIA